MNIQICWVREKKPDIFSRLIMWFTKAKYSHVLIRFNDRYDRDCIYHATSKGVHVEPYLDYLGEHEVAFFKNVELVTTKQFFWGFISGSDGKAYSQWQIFRIATGINWFKKNGKAKMICSETVGEILHYYTDYALCGDRDLWTPKYLLEVITSQS